MGFPGSSVCKESTCNAGDPSSIPGLGRSAGEGIGYPLQDFLDFPCVALLEKNLPAMWEIQVGFLGWEDPLEEGMATQSSILAGESHGQRNLAGSKSRTRLRGKAHRHIPWHRRSLLATRKCWDWVFKGKIFFIYLFIWLCWVFIDAWVFL